MNRRQRATFIRQLSRNITREVLEKVDQMPDTWDGHELRMYLAEKYADSAAMTIIRRDGRSQRAKEYRNTIATTNL